MLSQQSIAHVAMSIVFTTSIVGATECDLLLRGGIFNVSSLNSDISSTDSFLNWFCDNSASSSSSGSDFNAFAKAIIPAEVPIPLEGRLGFSHSQSAQASRRFCSSVSRENSSRQIVRSYLKTASLAILDAFNKCVSSRGFHVWLEYAAAPNKFTLMAKHVVDGSEALATINNFVPGGNVSCKPSFTTSNFQLGGPNNNFRSLCTRTNNDAVDLIVNASRNVIGGSNLHLPPISRSEGNVCEPRSVYSQEPTYWSNSNDHNQGVSVGGRSADAPLQKARLDIRKDCSVELLYYAGARDAKMYAGADSAPTIQIQLLGVAGSLTTFLNTSGLGAVHTCGGFEKHSVTLKGIKRQIVDEIETFNLKLGSAKPTACPN